MEKSIKAFPSGRPGNRGRRLEGKVGPDEEIQLPILYDICNVPDCGGVADWLGHRRRD
jgi:hypothetical protein